jgi:hypothetical protein
VKRTRYRLLLYVLTASYLWLSATSFICRAPSPSASHSAHTQIANNWKWLDEHSQKQVSSASGPGLALATGRGGVAAVAMASLPS